MVGLEKWWENSSCCTVDIVTVVFRYFESGFALIRVSLSRVKIWFDQKKIAKNGFIMG